MLRQISDDEMDSIVEQFMLEQIEKNKKEINFILNRQEKALELLHTYFQTHQAVSDEDEDCPIDSFEFHTIFTYFLAYAQNKEASFEDEDNCFPNENAFVQYKDQTWEIFMMHGQGTFTCISLAKEGHPEAIPYKEIRDYYLFRIQIADIMQETIEEEPTLENIQTVLREKAKESEKTFTDEEFNEMEKEIVGILNPQWEEEVE